MAILADQNPVFQRAMRIISDITKSYPAVVTTTFAHQYRDGMIVRLIIPKGYGMAQANQLYAPIVVTGDTTFTIDIDTTYFDDFILSQLLDFTDGSGNASGFMNLEVGFQVRPAASQTFTIGGEVFTVPVGGGNLVTNGTGAGTLDLSTTAYTFTNADANTGIIWNPVIFPYSQQYAQCLPTAEITETLLNATQNILPFSAE